jgi:hypothetical protein
VADGDQAVTPAPESAERDTGSPIGSNVPLPMIAQLLARLAPHAIVEFVPKTDPMAQRLLAARRDVFEDYTIEGFRAAFTPSFEVVHETPIAGSQRTVFLLRRRSAG